MVVCDKRHWRVILSTGMLVTGLVLSSEANAQPQRACLGSVCFATQIEAGNCQMPLRGTALLEYFVFDVYTAAFYADQQVRSEEQALESDCKALVVQYHRSLSRSEMIESTAKLLHNNPEVDAEELRSELAQLYALYSNVAPGDRYTAYFDRREGTTLMLNGSSQGTIPGEAFQRAYFGIWLSRHSVDEEFTAELLGKGDK